MWLFFQFFYVFDDSQLARIFSAHQQSLFGPISLLSLTQVTRLDARLTHGYRRIQGQPRQGDSHGACVAAWTRRLDRRGVKTVHCLVTATGTRDRVDAVSGVGTTDVVRAFPMLLDLSVRFRTHS